MNVALWVNERFWKLICLEDHMQELAVEVPRTLTIVHFHRVNEYSTRFVLYCSKRTEVCLLESD